MIEKDAVKKYVETYFEGSDNFLVSLEVRPGNVIVVEFDNNNSVSIEDCVLLNRFLESKLDRNIEDYELEVGSSGIGQAFKVLKQYQKNKDNEVEVLAKNGQKYSGILKEINDDNFSIIIEKQTKPEGAKRKIVVNEVLTFKYDEVKYTKNIIRFK